MTNSHHFAQRRITDSCLLVEDLARSLAFYRDLVGFPLRRRAPGFADFATEGVTLALWERGHMTEHTGIPTERLPQRRACMIAVQVESPSSVDQAYRELGDRGLSFLFSPTWYPWNAYACYFEDPDRHLWEIYAWGDAGHAGLLEGTP
jgi:catechol 2,3-dioxygenase-like lactoylglutathione lyase family enzyme